MDERTLRISVEGAWLIRLVGHLDASTAHQLDDAMDRPGYVVVDCSELEHMDRVGADALIAVARAREHEQRDHLVITGLTGAPLRVAQHAGLDDVAEVRPMT